jgi:hypothetical protein
MILMTGMTAQEIDPGSFRDPSGHVFRRDGTVFRQVNACYRENYDALLSSGLYDALVRDGLLVSHAERGADGGAECYKVIEPERIPFISYPYEWCFGQLRDAALATLAIQKTALSRGMSLKDASAFNIQFKGAAPVHIDTLSFERYVEGSPWIAYRQFCEHFLAPLALMSFRDVRCSRLLRSYLDGVPLELASRLLLRGTRFSLSIQMHIHIHARMQKRYQGAGLKSEARRISLFQVQALIDSLESCVRGLKSPVPESGWSGYYSMDSYSAAGFESKKSTVARFVEAARPGTVWDFGANTGVFSRIAGGTSGAVLSIDSDHDAVELNYRQCRRDGEKGILPLWIDLMNPSGGLGWDNRERLPLKERGRPDMVIALALVHHLAIAQNVPLDMLADYFASIAGRWLVIEFVPKADPKVRLLLGSRADIFHGYTRSGFESAFAARFKILESVDVADSTRTLYLMQAL